MVETNQDEWYQRTRGFLYTCPICKKEFLRKQELENHILYGCKSYKRMNPSRRDN